MEKRRPSLRPRNWGTTKISEGAPGPLNKSGFEHSFQRNRENEKKRLLCGSSKKAEKSEKRNQLLGGPDRKAENESKKFANT